VEKQLGMEMVIGWEMGKARYSVNEKAWGLEKAKMLSAAWVKA
jgi:hypothetical protein